MGKLYRPKTSIIYYYGVFLKCHISCCHQQKWELIKENNERVELYNKSKNITIEIDHDSFYKDWILIESYRTVLKDTIYSN